MKKLAITTVIAMAFGTTAAFAHHPAADIVDPEIYAMIDENVSDTHAEMDLTDMGSDTTADMGSSDMGAAQDAASAAADAVADAEEVQTRGAMGRR
jgi:hypothetical protein